MKTKKFPCFKFQQKRLRTVKNKRTKRKQRPFLYGEYPQEANKWKRTLIKKYLIFVWIVTTMKQDSVKWKK